MIADAAQARQVALYNYALGGVEEDDNLNDPSNLVEANRHEAGPACVMDGTCATEVAITRDKTTHKTTYEIKLPKEALELTSLVYGTQFGLGMAINDGDKDTPGQRGWGGLGAHSIVFGKTPGETALVTLGVGGTAADVMYLSAVNPSVGGFSFRVNNLGASICDPATAKLYIDGILVPLTSAPKTDAFDFTHTRATPFAPSSDHTYAIEVKDTRGNLVADAGSFKTAYYAVLTQSMQATTVDKTKPGFRWSVFQNETFVTPPDNPTSPANTIAEAELALAGQLKDPATGQVLDNYADPSALGPALAAGVRVGAVYRFEIPTVINLNDAAGTIDLGNFTTDNGFPDDQMPGTPGITFSADGVAAEVVTFVELPAGWVKMGVSSDDGFRAQAGYINVPADAVLLGQFDGPRGTADTTFDVYVQDAGIYPVRTVYQEVGGGASLELFTYLADGTTKVLINDIAGGGLKAYRSGTAPNKPIAPPEFTKIQKNANGSVTIEWKNGGTLQSANAIKDAQWQNVGGATSPYTVTPAQTTFWRLVQ